MKLECSKCHEPLEKHRLGKYRYCLKCHAASMRKTRPKHSELCDEQRKKANARSYANVYLKRGYIIKKPCEKCGSNDAEKHHEDYNKPTEITWLCRVCHLKYHGFVKE